MCPKGSGPPPPSSRKEEGGEGRRRGKRWKKQQISRRLFIWEKMKDNGWEKHAAAVSVSGILHLVKEGGSECGFQLQDIVAANRFKGKYSTVPSQKLLFFSLNLNGLHYKSSMVTALVASDRRLLSFQDEVILLFPNPDVETHNCSKLGYLIST